MSGNGLNKLPKAPHYFNVSLIRFPHVLRVLVYLPANTVPSSPPLVPVPPPPSSEEEETPRVEARGPLPTGPQISEHQARAALLAHVVDRCCWGSGAAKQMAIAKISYDSAFHVSTDDFFICIYMYVWISRVIQFSFMFGELNNTLGFVSSNTEIW